MKDLSTQIEEQINKVAAFADVLPCVTMVHKLPDGEIVWMSERGLKDLGISLSELVNLGNDDYYGRFFNPEDAEDYRPKILGLLERNNDDECVSFFQQVKVNHEDHWTWHMSSTKILMRDEMGNPVLLITQSIPFETMHTMSSKANRILEENIFLRENITTFLKLSKRELQILKHFAIGESALECGEKLFISPQTVETHRKNIRKKLGTNSFVDLVKYARAFDLV